MSDQPRENALLHQPRFNPASSQQMQTDGNNLFGLPSLDVAGLEEFWTDFINDTSLFATVPPGEGEGGHEEDGNDTVEQALQGIDGSSGEPVVTLNSMRHVYPRKPTPRTRYEQSWKEIRTHSLDHFVSLLNVSDIVGLRKFIDSHCNPAVNLHSQQLSHAYSGDFAVFCFWNMLREVHPDGVFKVLERRVVSNNEKNTATSKTENRRMLKSSPSNSLSHLSHLHLVDGSSGAKGNSSSGSSLGSPKSPFRPTVSRSMSHSNEQPLDAHQSQTASDDTIEYHLEQQKVHRQQLSKQFTVLEVIIRLAGTPLTNLKLGELFTRLMSSTGEANMIHEQQSPVEVAMHTAWFLHAIGHTMDVAEALLQLPLATSNSVQALVPIPLTNRGERTYIIETTVRFDPMSGLIVDWGWEILAENSPPGKKTAISAPSAASSSSAGGRWKHGCSSASKSSSGDL